MNEQKSKSGWKKTLLISLLILGAALALTFLIFRTEPTAEKVDATKETAMLVDVVTAERGDYTPTLIATGTVQAAQDIMISPRVSGQIVSLSEDFVPGGYVSKGQLLVQIDPADFQNQLRLRKSELEQAKSDLKLEKGRQEVARQDFELLQSELSGVDSQLVLRQPQLESINARVEAAQASVEQAQLNLKRSSVRAPFNAHISRNAHIGSQVSPGQSLGRIVGTDEYWINVSIPLSQSAWINLPEEGQEGAPVKIHNRTAWPKGVYRKGRLFKKIGALDANTRLQQFLVRVSDPLLLQSPKDSLPPLIVGSFVETEIEGSKIPNVVRLNRDFLRQNNTAWVMNKGKLEIRELDIVFKDAKFAYIRSGIEDGDQVISTNLSTVVEGSALRTSPAKEEEKDNNSDSLQSGEL